MGGLELRPYGLHSLRKETVSFKPKAALIPPPKKKISPHKLPRDAPAYKQAFQDHSRLFFLNSQSKKKIYNQSEESQEPFSVKRE